MEFTAETAESAEKRENQVSGIILDAAIAVHTASGRVYSRAPYEVCLCHELVSRGLKVQSQVPLPIQYRDVTLEAAYRIDLVVEDMVIVEVKAIERLMPIHDAQLL